jgi:Asp-tRNA(Asn)/Glu-tRNA(Gln) amidotransferase A subunit family amidase
MSQLSDSKRERWGEAHPALTHLSATAIAQQIASGNLSSHEVVEAHIRQIEAVNPRLNAVVVPLFAQAREDAARADRAREQGRLFGPLHGVPITLKEQLMVSGTATTVGLRSQKARRKGWSRGKPSLFK